jgi:hypothetical protein
MIASRPLKTATAEWRQRNDRTAMICSSVNRFRFICSSFNRGRTLTPGGGKLGGRSPVSDYTGAAALLDDLPKAQWLLGDRGYDADWFRDASQAEASNPTFPGGSPAMHSCATTHVATEDATA